MRLDLVYRQPFPCQAACAAPLWLYSGFIDLVPTRKEGNKTVTWEPGRRWKPWWKFNMETNPLPGPRFLTLPYQVGLVPKADAGAIIRNRRDFVTIYIDKK